MKAPATASAPNTNTFFIRDTLQFPCQGRGAKDGGIGLLEL